MIKKYNKILLVILLFFILLFFAFATKVDAKEVTIDELTEKVKEVQPNASYLYVIGEYAFSSEHLLTTQDVMLAARTIEVSENSGKTNADTIYNEMAIIYLEATYDDEWNLDGLEYVSNITGTTAEKEKYEIKYIDYIEVFSQSQIQIEVNELVNDVYNTIDTTAANDKFEVSMENDTINVTMLDTTMSSVTALQGTGIASAAQNLLNEDGVGTVTIAIPNTTAKVEITAENLTEKLGALDELFEALAGTTNPTAADLAGKSITITIGLEEGYVAEEATTFTVTFDKKVVVEVDELVNDVYNTIDTTAANDKFEVSMENDTINVTMLDGTMSSVTALQGTGIATAAQDLLNEDGVGTVTIAIPNTTAKVEITAENLIENMGKLDELFVALAGNDNATAADLVGKSITVTIGLEEGYTSTSATTFTVSFN